MEPLEEKLVRSPTPQRTMAATPDTYAPSPEDQQSRYRKRMAIYWTAALISLGGMTQAAKPDSDWTAAVPYVAGSMVLGGAGAAALSRRDRPTRAALGAMAGPAAIAAAMTIYGAVYAMSEIDAWNGQRQERTLGR